MVHIRGRGTGEQVPRRGVGLFVSSVGAEGHAGYTPWLGAYRLPKLRRQGGRGGVRMAMGAPREGIEAQGSGVWSGLSSFESHW